MEKSVYSGRRKRLLESVEPGSIVILRGSTGIHIYSGNYRPFRQNSNFYYLTGLNEPNLILFLIKTKADTSEYLFIERADKHIEQWERKMLDNQMASEKSGIEKTFYLDEVFKISDRIVPAFDNIYIDENYSQFIYNKDTQKDIVFYLMRLYPSKNFLDIGRHINPLRLVKDEYEINCIQTAIDITKQALDKVHNNMHEGISENEILGQIMEVFLKNNTYASFSPIVGSGPESTILHYDKNNRKSAKDDVILIDIGTEYEFYSSDITRTFPSCGKFTSYQREAYLAVIEAQEYALSIARKGISLTDLNKEVREFQKLLYAKLGFASSEKGADEIIIHNISHYLGLDPHDPGDFNLPLKPGMVITIEPGIYLREKGFGIRVEDDIAITDSGNRVLSGAIMKKPDDIEK